MMRLIKFFAMTVILITLVVGVLRMNHSYAATAKPKNCFLLLYNDCFKNWDFKPNEKTWSRSAVFFDYDKFSYTRYDIVPFSTNLKLGTWFRWEKSFFMHQLCNSFYPPDHCDAEPGLPVYGGSLSGTTGQGFMTKTTRTYEWPVCWSIKPITKGNEPYCPNYGMKALSAKNEEEDEDDDQDQDPEDPDEQAAEWFREMRDPWLEIFGPKP
jgi:hypothetical protein